VSKEWSPKIAAAGAVVIDNSSAWRMDPDCAADRARGQCQRGLRLRQEEHHRNPNCSTAQLVVALKPLHDQGGDQARRGLDLSIGVGRGKDAMDELFSQTKAVYTNSELINKKFPKRIAFNVIPEIDVFMEDATPRKSGR